MQIQSRPFGIYETNCYIISHEGKQWAIDTGMGSHDWVLEHCPNLRAILLTHGHFDHIFDVARIKSSLPHVPIYCPKEDCFMLESDCFDTGITPCKADVEITNFKSSQKLNIAGLELTYHHLPGHTPGCSIIELEDCIFSGDFVFRRSIGRFDFPYSDKEDMRESLQRFRDLPRAKDKIIYAGHGESTWLFEEQENVKLWIQRM